MKARIVVELQEEIEVLSVDEARAKADILVEAFRDVGFGASIEVLEVDEAVIPMTARH